jgi:hypothetical protein
MLACVAKFMPKLRAFCFALVLIGIADASCTSLWFHQVKGKIIPARDTSADAAIVLFSGFEGEVGVDRETQRRLAATVALYRDKRVRYVLCIGGARPRMQIWGAKRMKQVLLSAGIPSDVILLDLQSNDTISNIEQALRILKERNLGGALVVSSPIQLSRIRPIVVKNRFPGRIDLAPYDYLTCTPEVTRLEIWLQIHHEWLARAADAVLPPALYRTLIGLLRR